MGIALNRFQMFPESLYASSGFSVVATSVHGQIDGGHDGFYFRQTRFLCRLVLTVNGERPTFVSANPVDSYSMIAHYAAPTPAGRMAGAEPDDPESDGGEIAKKAILVQVNRFVGGGMHQDLLVTNHGLRETEVELAFEVGADYADVEEIIEGRGLRLQNAEVSTRWVEAADGCELTFTYQHPQLPHGTVLRFARHEDGPRFDAGKVVYRVRLAPRQRHRLCLDVIPLFLGERIEPVYGCEAFHSRSTRLDRVRETWSEQCATLKTPNHQVQAAWDRSLYDLGSLPLHEGEGDEVYTPAAGIPLYQELYARDPLTTGWQASIASPLLLKGTLQLLGRYLGTRYDPAHDEQPGRTIQQAKMSPLALLGANPFLRYYGDYAGPGMYLISAASYFVQTGDRAFIQHLMPNLLAVLEWIDRDADIDGDGFYEYETHQADKRGKNQGWMDSPEALLYEDGRMMPNPIAVVEVQGYYFAAKQLMGLVFLFLGDYGRGRELLAQAQDLKRRFNQAFWLPDEKTFAQALDPDKRPVRNIASNPGHCLACGIVDRDKAAAVAGRLMAPDMFSGWGIRTLSSEHPAFNPFAYHLGSVWPSENASIALGFKRYGLNSLLHDLARGILDATEIFDQYRLPEAIGGYQRSREHPHPGIYPQSNAPQSWSSSAIVLLIQALTGLFPLAPLHTLVVDPDLPEWLPELTLENLQVGEARVSLRFHRDATGHTHYEVLARTGKLHLMRQAPPESLTSGFGDRLADLVTSLLPH